jgi:hypothetical protein
MLSLPTTTHVDVLGQLMAKSWVELVLDVMSVGVVHVHVEPDRVPVDTIPN